jgi:Hypothetical glycosyl hydrolase family 15
MRNSSKVALCILMLLLGIGSSHSKPKDPIDTWENIHTFLVFDNNVTENELTLLSRYDFIWGAGTYVHTHQPPIPPKMLVTFYMTGDRDDNAWFIVNNVHRDLAWYQLNHPDWIVYQCDRQNPAYEFGQPLVPIDISNPGVIAFQASAYGQWGADHGEDGLAADNMSLQNVEANRCGIFKGQSWVQLYSGNQQDPKFAADVVNWAHQLRARLHKLSPPQRLIVNLATIDFLHPQQPYLQRFFHEVDGVLEEGGFFDTSLRPLGDNDWVQKIRLIRDIQRLGVPYYGINEYPLPPNAPTDCSAAGQVSPQFIGWSVASYLMSKEHSAAMYMSRAQQYGCALWYPEYQAKVGHPCGEMFKAQNVYIRDHSKALSIVNTSATETFRVNLPAGRQYVDLQGNSVSSPVTISPQSGHVLLIAMGSQFCR